MARGKKVDLIEEPLPGGGTALAVVGKKGEKAADEMPVAPEEAFQESAAEAAARRPGNQQTLAIANIRRNLRNPRKHFDQGELDELTASILKVGVIEPVVVRPYPGAAGGESFELICGERRWRAAKAAGLVTIPAVIRELDDQAMLEIMIVENLHRRDLHPLEEASGYASLQKAGYDAARIAARIGRSVKYVYDRLKLLELTDEAQDLFNEDRISAGHAILLARLKPADQARALCVKNGDWDPDRHDSGGVFVGESLLFDPNEDQDTAPEPFTAVKTRSVRELQAWIDENVRLDADEDETHPMLFPVAAQELAAAREVAEPVVNITHDFHVVPEAKDGARIYGPRSWKRADKACDHSVTGVIVIGYGRGEAFKVCVQKDKCKVHWAAEQKAKKKKPAPGAKAAKDPYEAQRERYRLENEKRAAAQKRWEKAAPAIVEAVLEKTKAAPWSSDGLLIKLLSPFDGGRPQARPFFKKVPLGTTPMDFLRHLAWRCLLDDIFGYAATEEFPKIVKKLGLGIDVKKILDQAAPVEKVQTSAPKAAPKKKGKARAKAK